MRYRLVIFDFDGTLADSFPWFVATINTVADRYGFRRIEEGELDLLRGYSAREMVRHLGIPSWKLPLIAGHIRKLKARDRGAIGLFPGVGALLRQLAEGGVVLAIVSSNAEENVRQILGPELAPLIRHYACGASLFGKAAGFKKVLRMCSIRPGEALCVGDELRDLEAAREAGIPFGAVTWGYTTAEALGAHGPQILFTRVEEVAEAVVGRGGGPGERGARSLTAPA
jgi:phosphoglycolate phosphatase